MSDVQEFATGGVIPAGVGLRPVRLGQTVDGLCVYGMTVTTDAELLQEDADGCE